MPNDTSLPDTDPPSALPRGTRLGEFELLRVLGVGGFSIVYLAFDHALEREVAVKEYMPASLVGRTETRHVTLRSSSDADTFALGLKSFVNEARMLARFDHPSLLKVHRFWEDNGTAYMAMPVIRGRTLKQARALMLAAPDEAWLRALLNPLLDTLELLHREGIFHRDIAPDNIVLEADGRPMLLDFGAARRVIGDKSQALTAILKPAYAPIEQYGEAGSVKQGPWTDLYALGATVHFLLLGRPPAPATARMLHDEQPPLRQAGLQGCTDAFLNAIDWMLGAKPVDRPQNVAALRAALAGSQPAPERPLVADLPMAPWETTRTYTPADVPAEPGPVDPVTLEPTYMGTVRVDRAAVVQPDLVLGEDDDATRVVPPKPAARAAAPAAPTASPAAAPSASALPADALFTAPGGQDLPPPEFTVAAPRAPSPAAPVAAPAAHAAQAAPATPKTKAPAWRWPALLAGGVAAAAVAWVVVKPSAPSAVDTAGASASAPVAASAAPLAAASAAPVSLAASLPAAEAAAALAAAKLAEAPAPTAVGKPGAAPLVKPGANTGTPSGQAVPTPTAQPGTTAAAGKPAVPPLLPPGPVQVVGGAAPPLPGLGRADTAAAKQASPPATTAQRADTRNPRTETRAAGAEGRVADAGPSTAAAPVNTPAAAEPTTTAANSAPAFVLEVAPPSTVQRIKGPNERCGGRVLLALWLCIERECRKDDLKGHAECVKWRNDQEQKAAGGR